MDGISFLKNNDYSVHYARIGENYDDYETDYHESEKEEEQDFEYPSMLREFDDDYVIDMMNKNSPVEEYECNEL